MINLALLGSVAGNTLLSNLSSKLVDKLLNQSKLPQNEQLQYIFNMKLECYSQLSNEVLTCTEENICTKKECIKKHLSKIILLVEDEEVVQILENYLFILDEYDFAKEHIDIQTLNKELIYTLSSNIKKSA